MKRPLSVFLVCLIGAFCLISCTEKNENDQRIYYVSENITLVEVVGFSGNALKQPYTILVHKETRVMYIVENENYQGGISIMLDKDGKPLLWQGEL